MLQSLDNDQETVEQEVIKAETESQVESWMKHDR